MENSLFDNALASIGAAISDVREKFVEEAWFGRVVSPEGQGADTAASPSMLPAEPAAQDVGASPFEEAMATVIQAPPDPDIQPHGQVVDR